MDLTASPEQVSPEILHNQAPTSSIFPFPSLPFTCFASPLAVLLPRLNNKATLQPICLMHNPDAVKSLSFLDSLMFKLQEPSKSIMAGRGVGGWFMACGRDPNGENNAIPQGEKGEKREGGWQPDVVMFLVHPGAAMWSYKTKHPSGGQVEGISKSICASPSPPVNF